MDVYVGLMERDGLKGNDLINGGISFVSCAV